MIHSLLPYETGEFRLTHATMDGSGQVCNTSNELQVHMSEKDHNGKNFTLKLSHSSTHISEQRISVAQKYGVELFS